MGQTLIRATKKKSMDGWMMDGWTDGQTDGRDGLAKGGQTDGRLWVHQGTIS